jgi:hypothetical protein
MRVCADRHDFGMGLPRMRGGAGGVRIPGRLKADAGGTA